MTPHISRRSFWIVVFSATLVFAWTGAALVLSGRILQPSRSPLWLVLTGAACAVGAAGSWLFLFHRELARWRQTWRTLVSGSSQLALAAETANVGLWDWDPQSNRMQFSERWRSQTGYGDAEIENSLLAWLRLVHPEDEPGLRAALHAHAGWPHAGFEATYRLHHRDGSWRTMRARATTVPGSIGNTARLVGVQFDVTDRIQAEAEQRKLQSRLLESQKLESLGLLAGSIAHDFNNLLSGVLSNAELAQLDLPPESPVTTRVDQIKQAAMRMADLSREMLAYSGRGSFNVTYVDLNSLIREMSNLLTTGISKRVQLCYKFAEDPVVIEAEATQISQVLMNLITNASDAMNRQSGTITLTTGVVQVNAADFKDLPWAAEIRGGSYAFFEVEDQGCGMTPETVRRMFEPFYTTKPNGRGLGLAAVQDIVRSHHGALRVRSAPGAGTGIRVLLPVPRDMAGPADTAASTESGWRCTGTILVVDDDKTARDTAATLLAHLGFEVLQAVDGNDAVRCFLRSPRSICGVLLDATIPGLEGREVARLLGAEQPGLPVLLASGYCESEVMKSYAGVRVNGFVQKPIELGQLSNILQNLLAADAPSANDSEHANIAAAWHPKPAWA
jgi:PAS domain S-box-containing protein